MVQRRLIRAGVVFNRTQYFIDKGVQRGISYESLNARRRPGAVSIRTSGSATWSGSHRSGSDAKRSPMSPICLWLSGFRGLVHWPFRFAVGPRQTRE
jgi:hypothetical protein